MRKLIKLGALIIAIMLLFVGCGSAEPEAEESQEPQLKEYVSNELVNQFINDFYNTSELTLDDLSDDAVSNDASCSVKKCYVTFEDATDFGDGYNIEIDIDEDFDDPYSWKMMDVAKDMIKTLDPTLSDEEISKAFDELKSNEYLVEGYAIGDNVNISYFLPTKELSNGTNPGQIRIQATFGE